MLTEKKLQRKENSAENGKEFGSGLVSRLISHMNHFFQNSEKKKSQKIDKNLILIAFLDLSLQNMKAALLVFLFSLATSVLARPPSFDSEEYIDNNLGESIPPEDDAEDERADYLQM